MRGKGRRYKGNEGRWRMKKKRAGVRKKGKMKGVDGEDKGVGEERRGEERRGKRKGEGISQ